MKNTEPEPPIETNWVVITGPPASGKTTTVEDLMPVLGKQGYTYIPEIARRLIEQDRQEGKERLGNREYEIMLNHRIMEERENIEQELKPQALAISDRGAPDVVAYARYYGEDDSYARELAGRRKYKVVFYLEPLFEYRKDSTRIEDVDFAVWMHENLPRIYEELGYEVIHVPAFTTDKRESRRKRVDFILGYLGLPKPADYSFLNGQN